MTPTETHPVRSSVAGALLGTALLVLVVAIFAGAVAAVQANRTIDTLAHQLTDARGQIDELRQDNVRLDVQNQRLLAQNTEQHDQLDALIRYLRRHGLDIPKVINITPPASEQPPGQVSQSPKAPTTGTPSPSSSPTPQPSPRPTGPGSPMPTPVPTPPAPSPGLGILCDLITIVCPR